MLTKLNWMWPLYLIASLTSGFVSGCTPTTHPVPDRCSWVSPIIPDTGFETRWTRNEKEQVESLDEAIDRNCGSRMLISGVSPLIEFTRP